MKKNELIQEELNQISPLVASVPGYNVYSVPEGYFTSFPAECMNWISLSPSFGTIATPQLAPEGYFKNLASEIIGKIKATEEEPVLQFNSKLNPFTVPSGYFDQLPGEILQRVDSPAKVISINRTFFRYAAAAVITGLLGIGLFNNLNNTSGHSPALAQIDQTQIKTDLDLQLEGINDNEIVNYLKDRGQDIDAALVASITDDSNLPSDVDYLINENTLSELLIEKNIRQSNN